jgi:hypothetical protein
LSEQAILLAGSDGLSSQDNNLRKLLEFFGVSWRPATVAELLTGDDRADASDLRLLCSSDRFSELTQNLQQETADRRHRWRRRIHSAFVYAGDDSAALARLAETHLDSRIGDFEVSDELPDFCGVVGGIRIPVDGANGDLVFASPPQHRHVELISSNGGAGFVRLECDGVPVFLCSSKRIIDIESELSDGVFDVRDHVLEAVPPVLYLKWAFAGSCLTAPERSACLIIDDPLLKPTYGFVHFRELLSIMQRYNFSTNIAFIPWNWRRSDSRVARLFKENSRYYSISVHGCAHTRAEFGSDDPEYLSGKARQALERMRQHESSTGIVHDRVMVFPQGVFSETAMDVLKQTDLIAAVNNDTIGVNNNPRAITVADVWDTAIMAYNNFPLFTRRYPWSGIENFAFDSLLGKPVLIVVHHDFCRDHCVRLIEFIEQLNALPSPLTWRGLGEVIRRSCRQRVLTADLTQVEMYGKELYIENLSERTKQFLIRRRESDPSLVREVFARSNPIPWEAVEDRIQVDVELKARQSVTVRLCYHQLVEASKTADNLNYRARTRLRRYLCELRDNYLHKLTLSSNGN